MIEGKISQANGRLKSAKVGVTIEQRGSMLVLRATLPPKPESSKSKPYQQRLALGIHANPAGLRQAEKEARKVGALLDCGEFNWAEYSQPVILATPIIGDEIRKIERQFFADGGTLTTWNCNYLQPFKKLDTEKPLEVEYLAAVVEKTAPDSMTRRRCVLAFNKLLRNAGIESDLSRLAGKYSPKRVSPRDLPSDELISISRSKITNPGWRWVYGMMATYGLRNHEVFHLDLDQFPIVHVLHGTKTGARAVWPCYPEWAEEWNLGDRILPNVDLSRLNQQLGQAVSAYLSPKLSFKPYDLRHAWAIRTAIFAWPSEMAAHQMGHSLEIHTQTYQRWITTNHHQQVYELLVARTDRPRPPETPALNP